jgi:ligand-binding sensor protein
MSEPERVPLPALPHDASKTDISMTRLYLPFAMVIAFGSFLVVAGYTVGTVMSGIARDKTEVDARLSSIEKEVTAIKGILSERAMSGLGQGCRCKP